MTIIGYPLVNQRPPRAQKIYVADTFRGRLRVRKWPRPHGTKQEPHMLASWEWLAAMVDAYKWSDGRTIETARAAGIITRTRPQDHWLHVTAGRAYLIELISGLKIYPQRFVATLSHALDCAAFAEGAICVRASDGWRPLKAGQQGAVLTMGATVPLWSDSTEIDMSEPTTAYAGAVSDSLDAITQTTGALMFRGPEFWQALEPGNIGDILTVNTNGFPVWAPPA